MPVDWKWLAVRATSSECSWNVLRPRLISSGLVIGWTGGVICAPMGVKVGLTQFFQFLTGPNISFLGLSTSGSSTCTSGNRVAGLVASTVSSISNISSISR